MCKSTHCFNTDTINVGFRESRNETDPAKLKALFTESFAALKELRRYEVMKSDASNIKFDLHF